jgi:nucleoside-diphosphate-sugar epimerase
MDTNYLVTGGAGFIGSHLVEELLQMGKSVSIMDNLSSGLSKNIPSRANFLQKDIRDYKDCLRATSGMDVVFHMAALRTVAKSFENPDDYFNVNIVGTHNILKAATENKVRMVIFSSSSSVYGNALKFPQEEGDIERPMSPYSITKLAGEHLCRLFSLVFGLNTASLRYFNVFGERQPLASDYAVVIPKFITNIIKGEPLPVFGTGKQVRDFTYVKDVVEANILASNRYEICGGEVFNIAGGSQTTILELVDILNKKMNKNCPFKHLPERLADVFRTEASIKRAEKFLGYKVNYGFDYGIDRTIEFFKKEVADGTIK